MADTYMDIGTIEQRSEAIKASLKDDQAGRLDLHSENLEGAVQRTLSVLTLINF